jgi:CHAD domain-containing protein
MELRTEAVPATESSGLDFWMSGVIQECENVRRDFTAGSVHDLRVALRRCRSIADGLMSFDPHPAWKLMKDQGKRLFRQLGALRDIQVMIELILRFAPTDDPAALMMVNYLKIQERVHKESASEAVQDFNLKDWASWSRLLPSRVRRIPVEDMAFQHLALQRWTEARALHSQALRNRSHACYHRLRIGLKKFRYTVENFLPSRHVLWGVDLRELQDLLGEMHDLYVLWQAALKIKAVYDEKTRNQWQKWITQEFKRLLARYREKTIGSNSLWTAWRSKLPAADQLEDAGLARLRQWASFRDPDFVYADHLAKLALQLYEGLKSIGLLESPALPNSSHVLQTAALLHGVGRMISQKKYQQLSYRMIRRIDPPLGWSEETLRRIALVARFHRGAIPHFYQKAFGNVPREQIKAIVLLCGILRLAWAFDRLCQHRIRTLGVKRNGNALIITAPGYLNDDRASEKLAAARHLLETACNLPILITQ